MKQKRVQKSLSKEFFDKIKDVKWGCVLADAYTEDEDHFDRYCELTILDDTFLESLGVRELQRFNKVRGGLSIPQGWSADRIIEQIKSSFEDTIHINKSGNLLTGKEEEKENINVVMVQEDSEGSDEVCLESYIDKNNPAVVEEKSSMSLLETENMVSGAILAKLTVVNEKMDLILELLSKPIIAASGAGVSDIDMKIAAALSVTEEEILSLSLDDLKSFAKEVGVSSNMYSTFLRESVIKEVSRLRKVKVLSHDNDISTDKAEKALSIANHTGLSLRKALKIC